MIQLITNATMHYQSSDKKKWRKLKYHKPMIHFDILSMNLKFPSGETNFILTQGI